MNEIKSDWSIKSLDESTPIIKTITLQVMQVRDEEIECINLLSQIMERYGFIKNMRVADMFKIKYG